jgi:HEAT repeat protein
MSILRTNKPGTAPGALQVEKAMRKNLTAGTLVLGLLSFAMAVSAAQPGVSDLINTVRSGDVAAQGQAIEQLIAVADEAAEAVPALVECLKSDSADIRALAVDCLGDIGKPALSAVPALVALVGDPDAKVRREVIEAVRAIRPGPKVVLPLLVKELRDSDPAVQIRALDALAEQGERAVPALIEALGDKETAYWACLVLSELGPEAKDAVPALAKVLDDDRPDVRREAILALAAIGEAAAPAVPAVAKSLDCEINAAAATYALGMIGNLPADVEAKIEKNVGNSDRVLATVSAWAVAHLHPDGADRMRRAVKMLIAEVMGENPELRRAAAQGLFDLKPDPAIARPLWEAAMENADEESRIGGMDAMASLGAAVVPRLIEALEDAKLRPYVASILAKIGSESAAAAEPLAELVTDENPETRKEALFALAKIGPAAKAAVPKLIEALKTSEGPDCYAICYALGSIGAEAVAAKPALQAMLDKDGDETACLFSAWALTRIDPTCEVSCAKAVPALIKSLDEPSPMLRMHAAEALGAMGPRAKSALPALKKAAKAKDEQVRKAAAAAIEAINK